MLDLLYDGDAEEALELYAVGPDVRRRAIERARAAGLPDPERLATHRRYLPGRAQRHADTLVSGTLALGDALDLTWPVAEPHRISSGYGNRHHPVLGKTKFHNGVDLAVPTGTPILAAQRGRVSTAAEDRVNGKYLVVDHGNGLRTSYCHLSALEVAKGEAIDRGQRIAASGNTGRSTGPHLHFVVRVGRRTVDPERLRHPPES